MDDIMAELRFLRKELARDPRAVANAVLGAFLLLAAVRGYVHFENTEEAAFWLSLGGRLNDFDRLQRGELPQVLDEALQWIGREVLAGRHRPPNLN